MKEIMKVEEIEDHAREGAIYAREVLNKLDLTTADETDAICNAVCYRGTGAYSELGEILLDANIIQHSFYNPLLPIKYGEDRLAVLLGEFGIN